MPETDQNIPGSAPEELRGAPHRIRSDGDDEPGGSLHSHGIDGPFIVDFPSYKPPFMGDFPWLC